MTQEADIVTSFHHGRGWIKLNRPSALNALSPAMMKELSDIFSDWAVNPKIESVIITGEGGRAFCAGGDLRAFYKAKGDQAFFKNMFRIEYEAPIKLKLFPKPYVALLEGYVMGGGMGASIHGSHRIVTDNTRMAMPETSIGFFPDVGASYFLNECPGYIGLYLGLTGKIIHGIDGIYAKWATHYVPPDQLINLKKALYDGYPVEDVVERFCHAPPSCSLKSYEDLIHRHFCHESVEAIFESLASDEGAFSQETLGILKKRSPLSLKVTFQQIKSAQPYVLKKAFGAIMASEFHLSQAFVNTSDFFEGIRAAIIDKDQCPRWKHRSIDEVTAKDLAPFFQMGPQRFDPLCFKQ